MKKNIGLFLAFMFLACGAVTPVEAGLGSKLKKEFKKYQPELKKAEKHLKKVIEHATAAGKELEKVLHSEAPPAPPPQPMPVIAPVVEAAPLAGGATPPEEDMRIVDSAE